MQYGGSVKLNVEVTDADALSHVEIRLVANQAVLYSKTLPGNNPAACAAALPASDS